jgi:hypothetical protein
VRNKALHMCDIWKMANPDHRLLGSDRNGDRDEKQTDRSEKILQ